MNATAAARTACSCSSFADATTGERLVCTATTKRTFAPGHDARLKGFLIRVGRAGHLVHAPEGGTPKFPAQVAERFGFAHMVRDGIARVAPARKAKKVAEAAPAPVKVLAKVGRWVYEGEVTANGGLFSYTDRKGNHLIAEKFTVLVG